MRRLHSKYIVCVAENAFDHQIVPSKVGRRMDVLTDEYWKIVCVVNDQVCSRIQVLLTALIIPPFLSNDLYAWGPKLLLYRYVS